MRCLALLTLGIVLMSITPLATAESPDTPLGKLEAHLRSGEIPQVHAVVVVQHGKTIAEWYFEGNDWILGKSIGNVKFAAGTLHDIRSVTKSVVSLLFGIAVAEGAIKNLDAPVLDYFPEYQDLRTPERLKIRLRDLLSMTSGFAWDERTYPYSDRRNSEIAMAISPDPYRYVLSQKIEATPGTRWTYSGGDVELIGAILKRATGMDLSTYAQHRLFAPLSISQFEWSKNNSPKQGAVEAAASGLRLTPRDMAKIGLLVLNGGRYEGKQVVPEAWVKEATARHAQVEPDPECGMRYGYFFWLGPGCANKTPWIAGIGNGGQRIWVAPTKDLVIAWTMGLYDDPRQGKAATDLLQAILEAIR